jgi:hypothetical protein
MPKTDETANLSLSNSQKKSKKIKKPTKQVIAPFPTSLVQESSKQVKR